MRMLNLNDKNRKMAAAVTTFAERPENWYHPSEHSWCPGDRPEYVTFIDTLRCVYTHTVAKGIHYRHLSVSIEPTTHQPHLTLFFTLATFFGFTGAKMQEDVVVAPGSDWIYSYKTEEHCLVLVQKRSEPLGLESTQMQRST